MIESYRSLLKALVEAGWCGGVVDGKPRLISDYIPHLGVVTADQFAAWVLEAEGWPVGHDRQAARYTVCLRALFIDHMGDKPVQARLLW